ncbi:MAG: hypothetical protein ABEJ99_01770 [Candidatus Nanohaloarchaea archaeon]
MVEFHCTNCGKREERNVLPGRHSVLGSLAIVNRNATCCENPDYVDSRGYKQEIVDRNLRELVTQA